MSLSVHVEKQLGAFHLKVDLEVSDEVVGLLGYSGCGKTMTLKMIAGIITPDCGQIILNNRILFDASKGINLRPQERKIGLMFQNYALFNHMSIYENIAIGMKGTKKEKDEVIQKYLKLLQLEALATYKPRALSGGQKQRVALARILAQKPDILMLDEPFSAIDSHLIFTIEKEFKAALDAFQGPIIYISHNRHEIYKYCHQVAVMTDGKVIEQKGISEIFTSCETLTGAKLTGCRNIASTIVRGDELVIPDWQVTLKNPKKGHTIEYVGLREGDMRLDKIAKGVQDILVRTEAIYQMPDKVKLELMTQVGKKMTYTCSQREYEMIKDWQDQNLFIHLEPEKLLYLRGDQ